MSDTLSADVVIVGSGVAGAMTGYSLARAGVKVLILEAGPRVDRAQAVSDAIVPMFAYLPNVIAALLMLAVGASVAQFAGQAVTQSAA